MTTCIAVLGDSIPGGTWLRHPERDSIVSRLRNGIAEVDDYSHGGATLTGTDNTIGQQLTRLRSSGKAYSTILVMAGTNDLVSNYTADPIAKAAQQLQATLPGQRFVWTTILPMGEGGAHPDGWLPALGARQQVYNQWLTSCGYLVNDWTGIWGEVAGIINPAYNFMLIDGLHPSRNGVLDLLSMFDFGMLT
jgi:lysophospholipase L1-like esterase